MKIFINTTNWAIVKTENEFPSVVGDNYVDTLKVYYDVNPSTALIYPTITLLKPNGRKVGAFPFDAGTVENPVPFAYTDADSNTWYGFAFTLSSDDGQLTSVGRYQVTITTNKYKVVGTAPNESQVITNQRNTNIQLEVMNAVLNGNSDILILGESVDDVVASMYQLCQTLELDFAALTNGKADRSNADQKIIADWIKVNKVIPYSNQPLILGDTNHARIIIREHSSLEETDYVNIESDNNVSISGADLVSVSSNTKIKEQVGSAKVEITGEKVEMSVSGEDETQKIILDGNKAVIPDTTYLGASVDGNQAVKKSYVDSADTTLQNNISNEELARQNADSSLGTRIDNEILARQNADSSLSERIDASGHFLSFQFNNQNYVLTLRLNDKNHNQISQIYIDLPLETMVVGGSYDDTNEQIILTLKNGNTIEIPVGDLVDGLQSEITTENPLDADLVDDTTSTHKFVTASEKAQITTNANELKDTRVLRFEEPSIHYGQYFTPSHGNPYGDISHITLYHEPTIVLNELRYYYSEYKAMPEITGIDNPNYKCFVYTSELLYDQNGFYYKNMLVVDRTRERIYYDLYFGDATAIPTNDVVEFVSRKVTSLSASSTDLQYPSAKCVYDALDLKADLTNNAQVITADKMYVNEIRGVDGSTDIKTTYNIPYRIYETKVKGTQGFADNFGVICQHSYSSLYREYYISGGTVKKEGFEVNRQETKMTKGDNTLKIDYTTNKLTYNSNEVIDTANATTELFLTDAEMTTLLSEVFD